MERTALLGVILPLLTAMVLLTTQVLVADSIASTTVNRTIIVIWYDGQNYRIGFYDPGLGVHEESVCGYSPYQASNISASTCNMLPALLQKAVGRVTLVLDDGNTTTIEALSDSPGRLATSLPQPVVGAVCSILLYRKRQALPFVAASLLIGLISGLLLYESFRLLVEHMTLSKLGLQV